MKKPIEKTVEKSEKLVRSIRSSRALTGVRIALLVVATLAIGAMALDLIITQSTDNIANRFETLFFAVIALASTYIFDYLEKNYHIILPQRLVLLIIAFVLGSLVLGEAGGFYGRFWWWDDLLHLMSGIIIAIAGFLLIYYLQARFNTSIHPLLVALFTFCFALSVGVLWEVFEFTFDATLGLNMQRWDAPAGIPLLGHDYQGNAVRDTMSDLIIDGIGALIIAIAAFRWSADDSNSPKRSLARVFPKRFNKNRR